MKLNWAKGANTGENSKQKWMFPFLCPDRIQQSAGGGGGHTRPHCLPRWMPVPRCNWTENWNGCCCRHSGPIERMQLIWLVPSCTLLCTPLNTCSAVPVPVPGPGHYLVHTSLWPLQTIVSMFPFIMWIIRGFFQLTNTHISFSFFIACLLRQRDVHTHLLTLWSCLLMCR